MKEHLPDHIKVYADLEGHKVNRGTIPQEMVVTSSLTDLVIVDTSTPVKTVYLFELTVCFEQTDNIQSAHQRKMDRYSSLSADIEERGYSCKNIHEVGSRGHRTTSLSSLSFLNCAPSKVLPKHFKKKSSVLIWNLFISRRHSYIYTFILAPCICDVWRWAALREYFAFALSCKIKTCSECYLPSCICHFV